MLGGMDRLSGMLRAALLLSALVAVLAAFPAMRPRPAAAAEGFRLAAPGQLTESGLLGYVLPRFSLKTGVRIELVAPGSGAEMALAATGEGVAVFTGLGETWRMRLLAPDHAGATRFADWLSSEIGRRTVAAFRAGDGASFQPVTAEEAEAARVRIDGDQERGRQLAQAHCGRCHKVAEGRGMNSIGSTPSFFALRALADWDARFQRFYAINPHPAFTRITGVSPPFPIDRPPPIVPLQITPQEVDDILAYVAALAPADLGGPIIHH
ncbi:MAG: hypothetical protein Kow0058_01380 [Roseovarius sp.]